MPEVRHLQFVTLCYFPFIRYLHFATLREVVYRMKGRDRGHLNILMCQLVLSGDNFYSLQSFFGVAVTAGFSPSSVTANWTLMAFFYL